MSHRWSILSRFPILLATLAILSTSCSLLVDAFEKSPDEVDGDGGSLPNCADWPSAAGDFGICELELATQDLVIDGGGWDLNTDSGVLTDGDGNPVEIKSQFVVMANGIEAQLILVNSLRMDSNINAKGSRPLVVASWGDIEINGSLQVEGSDSDPGAGANPADCGDSAGKAGLDDPGGAAGGGGGALGGTGGLGGSGDSGTSEGGVAGVVNSSAQGLRGGCPGGVGGNTGGPGGSGGGAVALVAIGQITIVGDIEAVGRGGDGGRNDRSGGGGGGSGGMILLASDPLEIRDGARLSANGGGGGGGAEESDDGSPGNKGRLDLDAANGGEAPQGGGNGGIGSSFGTPSGGEGGGSFAGGGGGGGGAGIIEFLSANTIVGDNDVIITPANR